MIIKKGKNAFIFFMIDRQYAPKAIDLPKK